MGEGAIVRTHLHFHSSDLRLPASGFGLPSSVSPLPSSVFRLRSSVSFQLTFKQVINIFDIIERIVDKKIEFRYGAHLVFDAVAQFEPDFFPVFFDVIE